MRALRGRGEGRGRSPFPKYSRCKLHLPSAVFDKLDGVVDGPARDEHVRGEGAHEVGEVLGFLERDVVPVTDQLDEAHHVEGLVLRGVVDAEEERGAEADVLAGGEGDGEAFHEVRVEGLRSGDAVVGGHDGSQVWVKGEVELPDGRKAKLLLGAKRRILMYRFRTTQEKR